MERRTINQNDARIKVETREGDTKEISGYAAVYYDGTERTEYKLFDDLIERIMPGAFDRALSEKDDARALFNHNSDHLLGRVSAGTLRLTSDSTGLLYSIDPGGTTIANDVTEHIKRGDLQGSSFAFRVTDQSFKTENDIDIRQIEGVELFDVGPVTYPAYESTTTDARSGACDDAKAARELWHKTVAKTNRDRRFRSDKAKVALALTGPTGPGSVED